MERKTKKSKTEKKAVAEPVIEPVIAVEDLSKKRYLWKKKLTGGNFYIGNRIIKPNEIFRARLEEIPALFRDQLICLDVEQIATDQAAVEAVIENSKPVLELQEVEGGWNVVNATGKVINQNPLTLEDAETLKKALMS